MSGFAGTRVYRDRGWGMAGAAATAIGHPTATARRLVNVGTPEERWARTPLRVLVERHD